MAEYIEREADIEAAKHAWAKGLEPSQYIEAIPAANVAPERYGRWEWFEEWNLSTPDHTVHHQTDRPSLLPPLLLPPKFCY